MRRFFLWILTALLLCGCMEQEVFERVDDIYTVMAPAPGKVIVDLPPEAAVNTMAAGNGTLCFCDGYTLTVQTFAGGDLKKTVGELTGFAPDQLTMFQTGEGAFCRYTGTWICAGETGDQVGQLVVLDDGYYHYAVTVMAPAENVGKLRLLWDSVLDSVTVERTGS